jgi:predicted MFS family arabinose efflux permease
MSTQIGCALGLFLFVPLGDVVDRRQLVSALLFGIIVSLVALALAPSLAWLDIASLTLGMTSAVAQVLSLPWRRSSARRSAAARHCSEQRE